MMWTSTFFKNMHKFNDTISPKKLYTNIDFILVANLETVQVIFNELYK
jgi:hypothetical protein